jgi:putative membrane protein
MPVLSEADLERVRAAVAEAEQKTSGEIVPYIVPRSSGYEIALWRGAVLGALVVTALTLVLLQAYGGWGLGWAYTAWGMAMLTAAGGALGAVVPAFVPAVRRGLAGRRRIAHRVHQRAEVAFLEEEVFATRARTGILLFISLFEHRIEVLGDTGVNAAVRPEQWEEIVGLLRDHIRQGQLADGLVAAVDRAGCLLEECGLAVHADAPAELGDDVRLRQR